jgi:hypothetical protein
MKALYKLHVNVTQEVQSHARIDTMRLQQGNENQDKPELILKQDNIETKDEKDHMNELE